MYSAVIWTYKWPCQISLEPLIMSLFFNFTALGSSILFSLTGIILKLLTGSWQFLNDVSHLPLVHSLKAWHLARCHLACQGKYRSSLGSLHALHTLPLTVLMKSLDSSHISEIELLWMLVLRLVLWRGATSRALLGHEDFLTRPLMVVRESR